MKFRKTQESFTEMDTLRYHVEGVTRLIVSALIDMKLIIDDYYNGIMIWLIKRGDPIITLRKI